jgi:hypothetical protein
MKTSKKQIRFVLKQYPSSKEAIKLLFPKLFENEGWEKNQDSQGNIRSVKHNVTNQIFSIGDTITISQNMSFGDGVRKHIIDKFVERDDSKIQASFKGYSYERNLQLDDIINLSR